MTRTRPHRSAPGLEALLRTASRLRGARVFHPRGVGFEVAWEPPPAATTLGDSPLAIAEQRGLLRVSRAVGLPPRLPDIIGWAIKLYDVHGDGRVRPVAHRPGTRAGRLAEPSATADLCGQPGRSRRAVPVAAAVTCESASQRRHRVLRFGAWRFPPHRRAPDREASAAGYPSSLGANDKGARPWPSTRRPLPSC
jgi:hypothetical protein